MESFLEEFDTYCQQHGEPERIELLLCDMNAVLRGKWLPGSEIKKLAEGKVRLPLSTFAPNILGFEVEASGLGIVVGDPDGVLVPITGSLVPVPWAEVPTAQVLVDMHEMGGEPSFLSTRSLLATTVEKFAQRDWHPVAAAELEFYLLQARKQPENPPEPIVGSPEAQNYDMESLARCQPVLDEILSACEVQGLPTDTLIAEFGPGQFEVNFHHSNNILAAADTALLFRRIVRSVAAKHGLEATFMAKPYRQHAGSGMHLHVSVVDSEGLNIFTPKSDNIRVEPSLCHAVAGTLNTMHDAQAVFAPHFNSLRRFGPGSFAPSAPEWGYDHRAAAVRIPETHGAGARLEHRISGSDVNPYLAITAILGGILHGLMTTPALSEPLDDENHQEAEPLASDWAAVLEVFLKSEFIKNLMGEDLQKVFYQVKMNELQEISTEISPAEYRYYLSRL